MKKARIVILILLIVLLAGLLAYYKFSGSIFGPYRDVDVETTKMAIVIPEGSDAETISDILEKEGIIEKSLGFRIFSKLKGYDSSFKAGKFSLSPGMTSEEIAEIITKGQVVMASFTIPEGYRVDQIAKKLDEEGLVSREKFMSLAETGDYSEYEFLSGTVEGPHRLEGFLFPETYYIPEGTDEDGIIRVMLNQFQTVWSKYEDRAMEIDLTLNEAITIASLIEREAVLDEDRKLVSSVIYNRLAIDMPLQIDATINFALDLIGEDHEYLTYEDLEIDSPYNTYKIPALPPGPIACPGERCIEAALYPPDTEYLYYVKTTDQGVGMSFSTNYEDFISDVEAWDATITNDTGD